MNLVAQERVWVTNDGESGVSIRRRISETLGIRLTNLQANAWNARFLVLNSHFPRRINCSTRYVSGVLIHLPERSFTSL